MADYVDRSGVRNNVTRLTDAMRDVRIVAADKADVVVDMKEVDRARLEILATDLKPVFDEVPVDNDVFDFVISSGLQPRLWIDATAHVMMGRDRRTYRFVRDTRLGRVVMAESTDMRPISDHVTRYVAERLIERQRLMEGECEPQRSADISQVSVAPAVAVAAETKMSGWGEFIAGLLWFIIGAVTGCGLLLVFLSQKFPDILSH